MEILKKITTLTVGAKPNFTEIYEFGKANPGKSLALYDVVGIVNGSKPGQSEHGEFLRFRGQFRATNLSSGAVFASGEALLPKIAESLIAGVLTETNSPEFGFRIGVKYDETAITKYVYTVESLIPMGESDPLEALMKRIVKPSAPALPNTAEKSKEISTKDKKEDKVPA